MFDIGLQEMVVIGIIALLVFGPQKLPELGRRVGRLMREVRRASDEFRSTVETNLRINEPDLPPPAAEPAPAVEPAPTPAAATAEAPGLAEAEPAETWGIPTEPAPAEPLCARRGARLVHRRECPWVRSVPEVDRVYFKRLGDAEEQGLARCPACEPAEPF